MTGATDGAGELIGEATMLLWQRAIPEVGRAPENKHKIMGKNTRTQIILELHMYAGRHLMSGLMECDWTATLTKIEVDEAFVVCWGAFGFYFEDKQRRDWLALRWMTAWVLDCVPCPAHWTGCQVGQVVSLLGLGTMAAILSCWPLPSGMSVGLMVSIWQRGSSPCTPVSSLN